MKGQLRIDEMFAFSVVDEDGSEGIIGVQTSNGWMPLVGADMERVGSYMQHAKMIAKQTNKKVTVLKFSKREIIEEILP